MSSEAAQKAYPERLESEVFNELQRTAQIAFDRGAVEALRQAAAEFDAAQPPPYVSDEEWTQYQVTAATHSFLTRMADEWERGSA